MPSFLNEKDIKPNTVFDIAIIGAGPAGLTAAIYALRDNKNVILFEKDEIGGQVLNSAKIANIPGFAEISGYDFIENMKEQIEVINSGSIALVENEVETVKHVAMPIGSLFEIITNDKPYYSESVIVATGSKYRTLGVPGEQELIGRGISFCSTCDAPFYKGREVAVIGGGNSALTEALELSNFATTVYIVQNLEELTAERSLVEQVEKTANICVITGATVTGFSKDVRITVSYKTYMASDYGWVNKTLVVDGAFLAIGMMPQNNCVKDVLDISETGYITGSNTLIKAAGDCIQKDVRQIATACGDGAMAAVTLCKILNGKRNI